MYPTHNTLQQTFVPDASAVDAKLAQPPTQDKLIPSTHMANMYPTYNTQQQTFVPSATTIADLTLLLTQHMLAPSTSMANTYPAHNV